MRRLSIAALLAAAAATSLAACGGSSKATAPVSPAPPTATTSSPAPPRHPVVVEPSRIYAKSDLPRLALQPRDAPADMSYVKDESGPQTLATIGLALPSQTKPLKPFGYKAVYDAVFASKARPASERVAQRIWLFKTARGASGWLAKSKADSVGLEFTPVDAPTLGDESWAAHGIIQFGGGQVISHEFRLGNAVFVVTTFRESTDVPPAVALAAAQAALERARLLPG